MIHLSPVICAFIENAADVANGLDAPFATGSDQVEHALDLCMVSDDLTVSSDVDKVERVQPVLLVDIDAVVNVL